MVRKNEEYRTLLEKSTSKRVRADNGAGPRKKPRCTRENLLEEANKVLKASLDERSTTVASLNAELRKRMETITGLIDDKARQQKSLAEQAITIKRLHDEASDAAATITRLGTEKTAMSVIVDDTMRENKALKAALAREEEPRPVQPTVQTQSAAIERTRTDLDDARPTRAELEAVLLRERQDAAQRTAQHNVAIQAAEATIRGLRDATKVLLAEIDRVSGQ
ncbi:hypothetical protein K438DRAFT_243190 [Mycena galopus ATCC 62051]|nr:hypothetical protein K438DRAFT_243190 [Mycena galopus ATCC 62051]